MAFLEDPRLRQRWNQISQNAETVTENAAAGIWTFQHTYINPCLNSVDQALLSCTSVCLGDRDDRARRQRERARGARRNPEYSFDFYDDWYDDYYGTDGLGDDRAEGSGAGGGAGGSGSIFGRGFFGTWSGSRAEDWDRLLAGSGSARSRHSDGDVDAAGDANGSGDGGRGGSEIVDQPRRRRGMSYGTRGLRRKTTNDQDDPTIIPSTTPIGFLGRLPFKFGGTLRYKPSAANLREHPGGGGGSDAGTRKGHSRKSSSKSDEHEPLLSNVDDTGAGGNETHYYGGAGGGGGGGGGGQTPLSQSVSDLRASATATRKRSGTAGSGDTSDSFRSRGDLFPSDEEGDEDAIPLGDEFAVALDRVDDRSSARTRFSSSSSLVLAGKQRRKGKKRAGTGASSIRGGVSGSGSLPRQLSRSVSRTTIASVSSQHSLNSPAASLKQRLSSLSLPAAMAEEEGGEPAAAADTESLASPLHLPPPPPAPRSEGDADTEDNGGHHTMVSSTASLSPPLPQPVAEVLSLEQIRQEEENAAREEHEAIERRRQAAAHLARERGLSTDERLVEADEIKEDVLHTTSGGEGPVDVVVQGDDFQDRQPEEALGLQPSGGDQNEFVPARLPNFR